MADGEEVPTRADDSRKKYSTINVASIADLKAELYKKQQEFRQEKPKAPGTSAVQAKSAPQKPSLWSKKNAGVLQRAASDLAAKVEEEDSLVKSRRVLEAKSKLYDKLAQSALAMKHSDESSGGDDDDEGEGRYLVDFSRKLDDEWVDYVDSLGRSRRCLRRDLPSLISMDRSLSGAAAVSRVAQPAAEVAWRPAASGDDDDGRSAPPQRSSDGGSVAAPEPTLLSDDMRRELMRQKWEKEEQEAKESNRDVHYANVRFDEIRDHGAGFYEFSKDEAVRAEEMKKLASIRQQTLHDRVHEEKLKQLRDEMLHVRLEAKRLQYMLRPGAASVGVPSDETRRKAEQQKIESLQQEISAAGAADKLGLHAELRLRQEIAGLRDAILAAASGPSAKAASAGLPENGTECLTSMLAPDVAGMEHEPRESTGTAMAAAATTAAVQAAPQEAAATTPSDTVKRLQAAMQQLIKLQQAQLEKLQRSKKRGPEDAGLDSAALSRNSAAANKSGGGDDDTFVGPLLRPAPSAASRQTESVREWDVGKPGLISMRTTAVPAKKSWKEQVRSERPEEFAPPNSYGDEPFTARSAPGHGHSRGRDPPARPQGSAASAAAATAAAPAAEQLASDWPTDRFTGQPDPAAAMQPHPADHHHRDPAFTGQLSPAAPQRPRGVPHEGVQQAPPPELPGHAGSSWQWTGAWPTSAAEPPPPGVAVDSAADCTGALYQLPAGLPPPMGLQQQHHSLPGVDQWPAQWQDNSGWPATAAAAAGPYFPQPPPARPLAPYYDPSVPPPRLPQLHQTAVPPPPMAMAAAAYTTPPPLLPPLGAAAYAMSQPSASTVGSGGGSALPHAFCSYAVPPGYAATAAPAALPSAQPPGTAVPGGGSSMQASVEAMLRSLRGTAQP